MADLKAGAEETARLEAALERIARARARRAGQPATPATVALAARLDALIAEIRAVLGKDSAG